VLAMDNRTIGVKGGRVSSRAAAAKNSRRSVPLSQAATLQSGANAASLDLECRRLHSMAIDGIR
jgi:hypothetical protein